MAWDFETNLPGEQQLHEKDETVSQTEPEQVRLFFEVLERIYHRYEYQVFGETPPVMVELGAAEGYYSHLFSQYFKDKDLQSRNICVDPDIDKIDQLKQNIPDAEIYHGYVGDLAPHLLNLNGNPKQYTIKEVLHKNKIDKIDKVDILYANIEGGEIKLLEQLLEKELIDKFKYYFITLYPEYNSDSEWCKLGNTNSKVPLVPKEFHDAFEDASFLVTRQLPGYAGSNNFLLVENHLLD
tara:strand:- start:2678 stop:3394 length:717 start_codon:yes stop_codon:yes gene_type:complete